MTIVHPKEDKDNAPWAFKTEYFDAFPNVQLNLLSRGYYLVNIQNKTRWCVEEDTDMRAEVAKYMQEKYHTKKSCRAGESERIRFVLAWNIPEAVTSSVCLVMVPAGEILTKKRDMLV